MKRIFSTPPPLQNHPPGTPLFTRWQPRLGKIASALICAQVVAGLAQVASAQTLQSAGDLILNLQSADLNGTSVWTNQTLNANSVGNMTTRNASPLNVSSIAFGAGSINALYVNGTAGNAVQSLNQAPAEILGNAPYSGEAWIYADNLNNQDIMSYGFEGGSAAPAEVRDMGYFNQGYGAFTGNFGNSDSGWNPPATSGVLHYLAWTYDGTNTRVYQDGVLAGTGGSPLSTKPSLLDVGCNINGGSAFNGYIAAARIESGVLSGSQISNNFAAGPLAAFGLVANKPFVSPGTNVFVGDMVTFTEAAQGGGTLTYQWQSDNGTGGATFTPIGGATSSNLTVNTGGLTVGSYEYQVIVTGGGTASSPPVTIKVNAASAPIVAQNISPATTSNLFVGYGVTFTASFVGNQPITYNWQFSTNGGSSYANISGATNSTLALVNLQLTNSGLYRLSANNGVGGGVSSAASVTVQPLSALPQIQTAGSLLVQLEPGDLNTNNTTWPNEISGVGDFTTVNGSNLNLTTLIYNSQPVNAVAVNGNGNFALNSALLVPTGIAGNGAVSTEAWIFPTTISGNNTVVGYGVQGGSPGAASEDREFDFGNSGGSAFSGNFGGDTGWSGPLTANTWHYVAWTFDGTTLRCYQDGVQNTSNNNGPLNTVQSVVVIGGGIAGADPSTTNRTDAFQGDIAVVRISTGVLTAGQVLNNFIAGPTRSLAIVLSNPTLSPSNVVFYGDSVTASVTNAQSLQTLTFQWQSDNGSGGVTWSNVTGQTDTNYSFSTTILPRTVSAANYEYRLVANGGGGATFTSSPVTLTVKPAAPPTILADTTTTGGTLFVGQQVTFTAAFTGNQPITNQWQVSTNKGATFQDIGGATSGSLTLTNLQLTDAAQYRLKGSNAFGSTNSTPVNLYVLPTSAEPLVQVSGHLIVNLLPDGLDTNAGLWHNETADTNSVGDFTFVSTSGPLNVASVLYNGQPINVLNVAGVSGNSVEALNVQAPAILLGANPCTMEAWLYATQVGNNNTVVNYGDQSSQSGDLDRSLNYQTQGYGAFTGYFGDADLGWNPAATANAWHYIAVTYDGSNLIVYQDGVANNSRGGITLKTDESYISVGSGTGGGPFAGANPLSGYVAAARVETGALTPKQIAQNFIAGPAPGLTAGLSIAQLAPLTSSYTNGVLTLHWSAGTVQEATSVKGPWTTDASFTSPHTITPATAGAPVKFYRLQY